MQYFIPPYSIGFKMKYLILLPILCASCLLSDELKRFVGSSDAGKTDPMLWMIINQLQASQTKITNLEHKVETKMSKLGEKLEATLSKLRDKDNKLNKKITDMEKKQMDNLGKHLSNFETKMRENSGKITDLKTDINLIKKCELFIHFNLFVCTSKTSSSI